MSKAAELAALIGSQTALSNRNMVINGAMRVAQRGTSATGVSGYIAVDRFRCTGSADAVDQLSLTHAQVTDVPDGFANSYKITVSTPETALAADEMIRIEHRMEGQNLQHLKKGTSSAEAVTLSFWIKGSVTGTYIVNLHDTDNTRTIAASYTINAANTWEYKTITFAGDTTGALDNDNAQSLSLYWYLGAGTDWTSGTLGTSWGAFTKANVAVGQTNILTTSGATWQITGVQLEVGETATPFEHRSFGDDLARCQRYYYRIQEGGTYQRFGTHQCVSSGNGYAVIHLPVSMREKPSLHTTGTASNYAVYENNGINACSSLIALNSNGSSTDVISIIANSAGNLAGGNAAELISNNNANVFLGFVAEL